MKADGEEKVQEGTERSRGRHAETTEDAVSESRRDTTVVNSSDPFLLDLVATLLRHRGAIALFTLAVPFLVAVATFVLPRSWTTTTSFMPQAPTDAARSRLSSLAGQFGFDLGSVETGQTPEFYADLIRARAILRQVAVDTFTVADTMGLSPEGIRRGPLPDLLGLQGNRNDKRREAAIRWLKNEALTVSTDRETGVVELSVTTRWPELSASIADRILDLVNGFNLETRQSQAAAERRFIQGRLEAVKEALRTAEDSLQAFLQGNRVYQNSPELAFEHDRLRRQVAMQQQVYTTLVESLEQAKIAEVRNTPVITVVGPPEIAVVPDRRRLALKVLLGLIVGGMVGTFGAFMKDYIGQLQEDEPERATNVRALWNQTKADMRRVIRR